MEIRDSYGYRDNINYGIIGNCQSSALIYKDSSIDWCCFPKFDSPSIFAKIIDNSNGGFFKVDTVGNYNISQEYLKNTCILKSGTHCSCAGCSQQWSRAARIVFASCYLYVCTVQVCASMCSSLWPYRCLVMIRKRSSSTSACKNLRYHEISCPAAWELLALSWRLRASGM